jgi:hypothetical protein
VSLLLFADHALLGLVFKPLDAYLAEELEQLEERYPVRFFCVRSEEGRTSTFPTVIDADGHLSEQVAAEGGGIALVRPDLHLAGVIDEAHELERALRTVLALGSP